MRRLACRASGPVELSDAEAEALLRLLWSIEAVGDTMRAPRAAQLGDAYAAGTARKLLDEREHTVAEIAEIVGCSRSTLYRSLKTEETA